MAIFTTQQLTHYYDYYRTTELVFSKEIIKVLGMDPRQIYIKCAGNQWPCILSSTSFQQAKIIVSLKSGALQQLAKKDCPTVNLRLCFQRRDGQIMNFFVAGKVSGIGKYSGNGDLAVVTIQYTQRPPDDFIEMIGHLIDANENYVRRRDERILITPENCRKLGIPREETTILIQGVPRRCILRDLSFGGAKAMVLGLAQFLMGKEAALTLEIGNPRETVQLKGNIVNTIPVEGRKDIFAASIDFPEDSVPLIYKIIINEYFSSLRKNELENQSKQEELAQQKAMEEQKIKEQRAQAVQKSMEEEAAKEAAKKTLREKSLLDLEPSPLLPVVETKPIPSVHMTSPAADEVGVLDYLGDAGVKVPDDI